MFEQNPKADVTGVLIIRPMGDVVSERLEGLYSRVLDVAETIKAAGETIDAGRVGLVCGIEIGHQREAIDALTQMFSELKCASETLTDIANQIEPQFLWQRRDADGHFAASMPTCEIGAPRVN